jgi:hypothetical protein
MKKCGFNGIPAVSIRGNLKVAVLFITVLFFTECRSDCPIGGWFALGITRLRVSASAPLPKPLVSCGLSQRTITSGKGTGNSTGGRTLRRLRGTSETSHQRPSSS